VIGDHLVLAKEKAIMDTVTDFTDAFTIKMQEGLAVSAYQQAHPVPCFKK
jgi:hypothetical protein